MESQQNLFGRPGNNIKMGIVGMPNIGKSTLFNVLTGLSVPAENFPFCTIDPSIAKVKVPDKRFDFLCEKYNPKSKIPAALTITDIAGLVRGASENQGLGNKFLSHIYAVDGIYHVVRAFDTKNEFTEHVEGEVDPVRDLEIISNELGQKDIEILNKKIKSLERVAVSNKKLREEMNLYIKVKEMIKSKKSIISIKWSLKEIDLINDLLLISTKPVIYLVNVSERDWNKGKNKWLLDIKEWVKFNSPNSPVIPFCAEIEKKIINKKINMNLKENKKAVRSHISKIIRSGYLTLNLCHFFTCGEKEVKCWTLRKNTKAKKAAGIIHTDFEKHFICAEVMSFKDYKEYGSENAVKSKGKYRNQGKEYIVKDGDIIVFKHAAGGAKRKK